MNRRFIVHAVALLVLLAAAAANAATGGSVSYDRTSPLVGRQFWGTVIHVDLAWDNRGVYFVDGKCAYEGLPKGGLPRCTAVTEEVDRNGNPTDDGCRRFRFNAATGALKGGKLKGTYRRGRLTAA